MKMKETSSKVIIIRSKRLSHDTIMPRSTSPLSLSSLFLSLSTPVPVLRTASKTTEAKWHKHLDSEPH